MTIKLYGCSFSGHKVDFSFGGGVKVTCLDCGHHEPHKGAIQGAGQAGVTTPTGQQAIPFIMGIGTVTNPALLGVGGGYGLLARMYESEPARNAMLRLANTPRGSTAFEKALSDVERAVNSFAQGAKSEALSE